jgi:rod shape-determining protein MreC
MRPAHRSFRILVLLVAVAAVLVTVDLRGDASVLRTAGAAVAGPAQQVIAAATPGDDRVRELEKRNAELAAALWAERAGRSARTQRDAVTAAHPGRTLVTARVVAVREHAVTIDAGSRDGIKEDMAVVTADGLVGRVIATGPGVSTVMLPTNPAAGVSVRMAGSRQIGSVRGADRDGLLRLRLLDADVELQPGQQVETLGSRGSRPYPPGIPVGTVVEVEPPEDQLTRTALVRPSVTFTTLDIVGVITGKDEEERRHAD